MKRNYLRLFLLIVFQFFVLTIYSQSSFNKGFDDGYKKGYCYDKIGCVSPVPPVAPLVIPGESIDSYQDGYNRGFKMGLEANKEDPLKGRYKTISSDTVIDYMYKPTELEIKIASKAHQNFETGIKRAQELYDQGSYSDCINLCNLISNMTHLVSYKYYNLISMSYDKLGNAIQSKKYSLKAEKFLETH